MSEPAGSTGATFWGDADESEALRRYRTLVDAVDDGIYQLDAEGRFVAVNDVIVETTGYDREQLVGSHVSLLLDEGTIERIRSDMIDRLTAEEGAADVRTYEITIEDADGEPVDCELRVSLLREDDQYRGSIGVVRDVTDRTRREETLESVQRTYDSIVDVLDEADVGVFVLNDEFEVAWINEATERYFGIDREEALGRDKRHLIEETIQERFAEPDRFAETVVATYDDNTYVERFECRVRAENGREERWLEHRSRPIESGQHAGGRLELYYDVTDRKQTERELRRRERELESELGEVLGRVSDAFYAVDDEFRLTYVNDRMTELTGTPKTELVGRNLWDVFPQATQTAFSQQLHEAMETGEERSFEATYPPMDAWFDVHAFPSETGLSVYFRDVTDRKHRERRLERSEQRYRALAEYFPNGIVTLFDHDLEYELAAGKEFDRIPVEPDDLKGEHFRAVWGEATADALGPVFESALDGEERSVELTYANREWIVHGVPITDERGDVFAGMTMAQDITEQKARERYLADAKSQLEAATEAGAIGTWEYRVPDDEMVVGPSFANTFGVDPEVAREGVSLEEFIESIHDADRERVVEAVETALDSCSAYEEEYRVWNAEGDLRWVVARGEVECDGDGTAVTFPGALTDITERKRAEAALRRSETQLQTLFEILPVGVVVAEADGELVEANDAARALWGGDVFDAGSVDDYERYDGRWAATGEPVEPDEWTMARVLDGEEVLDPDLFEIDAADGECRTVMIHGMPIRDERGRVVRGVVTQTDVTERRTYRRRLETAVDQLQESNDRLEQFAYAASHDLQEPLRMVTSYLQLIERRYADDLDADCEEFIAYAVDGAERMREMIDGLLQYSRVETRGDPFEPVDLGTVVGDVLQDLEMSIYEHEAEIAVDSLPHVEGDASQLRQLFQNLLTNAIEYSGEEPPRVRIESERAGDRWRLSVTDEGIGIDPKDQGRIFEVFQRLHGREEYEGAGIGLALCERIVERHGGEIRVDSKAGEGARFSFSLPAADDAGG